MKVIESDSGFLAFQKIFKHMQLSGCLLVVWQVSPHSASRNVSETRLNSYHMESKQLHLSLPDGHQVDAKLPLYLYSEDGQFIFKTTINEIGAKVLTVTMPTQIRMMEVSDVYELQEKIGINLTKVWQVKRTKLAEDASLYPEDKVFKNEMQSTTHFEFLFKSMSERTSRDQDFLNEQFAKVPLDEEDKLFAELRESPRAKPKIDKTVKVASIESDQVFEFKLYDLSTGGISFITMFKSVFVRGNKIKIMGFDEFDLDDPLIAEVMSERPVDETMIEYKIGCKFDEGQS